MMHFTITISITIIITIIITITIIIMYYCLLLFTIRHGLRPDALRDPLRPLPRQDVRRVPARLAPPLTAIIYSSMFISLSIYIYMYMF